MKSLLLSLCAAGALALSASPAKADDWHRGYPGYRGHYHHHGYYRGGYGDGWRSYYPGYNYRYYAPYYGATTRTALRIIGTPARTTTARVSTSATRGRARRFGSGSDQFSEKWNFCAASLLSGSRKNFL